MGLQPLSLKMAGADGPYLLMGGEGNILLGHVETLGRLFIFHCDLAKEAVVNLKQ